MVKKMAHWGVRGGSAINQCGWETGRLLRGRAGKLFLGCGLLIWTTSVVTAADWLCAYLTRDLRILALSQP